MGWLLFSRLWFPVRDSCGRAKGGLLELKVKHAIPKAFKRHERTVSGRPLPEPL